MPKQTKPTSNRVGIAHLDPRILPSNKKKETLDDEFHFADEIDPRVARELEQFEQNAHRAEVTGSESKETLARLEEQNKAARKAYRWPHQEDFKVVRTGKILHMNEFMVRLRRALPRGLTCWLTDKGGMKNTLGLFIGHPGILRSNFCNHEQGQPHYVTYIQVPFMQEYEE